MKLSHTNPARFNLVSIVILMLMMSSCVPQRKMKYLMHGDHEPRDLYENTYKKDYLVQSGDNLYIQVLGLDEQTADLFSIQPGGAYRQYLSTDISVYLSSYLVNPEGFIELPVIGKVQVKDQTVDEVKEILQKAINEYLRDATIIVKMVNFRISVLGEVMRPGNFPVYQSTITIFEALAFAGDLSPWADRKTVHLVRKETGGYTVHELDVSSRKILESEYFFLMPDDVLYVQPMKSKTYAFTTFPYSIIFSTITTTLLILNFIK
jgi:polysaccharide biosynthesis/export protein